ncbi:putative ribonuclease H-like domain-containing protein, partial [Tanacetum coccineum]
GIAETRDNIVTGQAEKKTEPEQEFILIPFYTTDLLISQGPKDSKEDSGMKPTEVDESGALDKDEEDNQATRSEFERLLQQEKQSVHPNSTNNINTVSTSVSTARPSCTDNDPSSPVNAFEEHLFERFSPFKNAFTLPLVSNVTPIDDTGIFGNAYDDEDVGAEADLNNLDTTMNVSLIPTTRIDKDHPKDQIIRDFNLAIQTRSMTKISDEHAMVCYINKQRRTNHKDYQNCLFACFLSQMEPKKVIQALEDPSWIEAMQEELLQFQLQKVWILVDLPNGKRAIGIKWVFRNKKDERWIIMDVKSAFLYGTIEEEVYVCQPPGFEDLQFPDKVYKVEKALYGLHQALKAWYETLSTYLIENGFRRGTIDKTLFIKKDKDDILLVHVYVDDIIFGSTKKSLCDEFEASTPMKPNKALVKDEEADSVDVHLYISMIGSLMYLTASRPDIMFAVCACARDSPFDLEVFSDSDYAGAIIDRKSTTGGCQFLGKRLISWQCKKQTIVANSTTKAEYVAAANCCGQVLWIQNQMLDYGFNFMNTKIYIDNESTICIIKNPVFHSKTKHIEIRHHFIRDSFEKKLIQVIKIHTDHNVADLLIKAFDVNETVYKEWEDRMERATTIASSLDAEQDSGNINRTQSMATLNESFPQGTDSGSGPRVKMVNGERQLHALVDKNKVILTKTSIRSDLHLEDAGGIDCLTTATIFEELARMGAKTTAWNEFSSTMASVIICLATNQKFNLSKYIFDAMLGDMSHHKKIYVNPSHTKKIFANMKREGKDFSGRVTPLFATMMIQANQEGVDSVPHPSDSTANIPNEESVPTYSNNPLLSGEDRLKLSELMDMCTKLTERVIDLEHTKTAQAQEITNFKPRVKKLEKKSGLRTHKFKRLYKVGVTIRVHFSDDDSLGAQEDASNHGRSIEDIDKDAKVPLVNETQGKTDDAEMFDTDAFL